MNNDHRRYHIIFVIATILNLLPVYLGIRSGTLYENGKIGMPLLNITVLIMMAVIYVELLVKKLMDKKSDGED